MKMPSKNFTWHFHLKINIFNIFVFLKISIFLKIIFLHDEKIFLDNFWSFEKVYSSTFDCAAFYSYPTTLQNLAPKTIHEPHPQTHSQITVFILIQSNIPEQYGPVGTRIEQYGFSSSSDVNWMTLKFEFPALSWNRKILGAAIWGHPRHCF